MRTVPQPSLSLMTVHAHPDDEAGSTGGVLHKYAAEGISTVVVTCTGGEMGDGPGGIKPDHPDHDPEAVRQLRGGELDAACRELGVTHLELLGYRDSGMAEWGRAGAEGAFAAADLSEAVARLSRLIERYRPQVIVSYDEKGSYGHPDHIRAHEIAVRATEETGIPSKLYYTAFPKSLARRVVSRMRAEGIDPWEILDQEFDLDDPPFGVADELVTTKVDVQADVAAKLAALRAHASQVDNAFFASLPDAVAPMIMGEEYFIRAMDRTGAAVPESDLFSGLR